MRRRGLLNFSALLLTILRASFCCALFHRLVVLTHKDGKVPPRLCLTNSGGSRSILLPICRDNLNDSLVSVDEEMAGSYMDANGKRLKGFRIGKQYRTALFPVQCKMPTLAGGPEFCDKFLHFLSFLRSLEPTSRGCLFGSPTMFLSFSFPLPDFVRSCVGDIKPTQMQMTNGLLFLLSLDELNLVVEETSKSTYVATVMLVLMSLQKKGGLKAEEDFIVSLGVAEDLVHQNHPFEFQDCFPSRVRPDNDEDQQIALGDMQWIISPEALDDARKDGLEIPVKSRG